MMGRLVGAHVPRELREPLQRCCVWLTEGRLRMRAICHEPVCEVLCACVVRRDGKETTYHH